MTVESSTQDVTYEMDGVTLSFAIPFYFLDDDHIYADFLDSAEVVTSLISGADFSLTGAGDEDGGSLTLESTKASGFKLHIYRVVPATQQAAYQQNSAFPAKTTETALDKLTMLVQQQQSAIENSVRYPFNEYGTDGTLPKAADRSGKVLGFDDQGGQTLLPIPAAVGAGDLKNELWKDGVDFVAGTSNSVTLSRAYGTKANIGTVVMQGVPQAPDTYELVGDTQLTFLDDDGNPAMIPVGVEKIYCIGGTTISVELPAASSVGPEELKPGAVGDDAIASTSNLYSHVYAWTGSKDNGATGNGTTNDAARLLLANNAAVSAGNGLLMTPGTYAIGSNLTFSSPVRFLIGARLIVQDGVTVTFNAPLEAPLWKIFTIVGTGKVVVNPNYTEVGCPEWWGATPNDSSYENSVPINRCIVAMKTTKLQAADYFTAKPIEHQTSNRKVVGTGFYGLNSPIVATRIVLTTSTQQIYQCGPTTWPGSTTDCQFESTIEDLCLQRAVAPDATSGIGFIAQYAFKTNVRNVYSVQNNVGFEVIATSDTKFTDCHAYKGTAAANGTDLFFGFSINGSDNSLGAAGGNASTYITRCGVDMSYQLANSYGLNASGTYGYSDLFIDQLETARIGVGIGLFGNGNSGSYEIQNEDVQIRNCVFDGFFVAGYSITSTSLFGCISIMGGYAAPAADAAVAPLGAVYLNNSLGAVTITGAQYLLSTNAMCPGLAAFNSRNISSMNCVYEEAGVSPVQLTTVTSSRFADMIRNFAVPASGQTAVNVQLACNRNKFDMQIDGMAAAFSAGYGVSSASSYSEYNCTGLNPGVFSNTNGKLFYNGSAITSVGAFGTSNYASGVMG